MADLIDGKAIAAQIKLQVEGEIKKLGSKGITPGLGVILVGDDPASRTYVRMKQKMCGHIGIHTKDHTPDDDISQENLIELISELNEDSEIHGILVQLPLPRGLDENEALLSIHPEKDVDGFHPVNIGKVASGIGGFAPATPAGVVEILLRSGNDPAGKHVVIVGRSRIVGRPLANLLTRKGMGGNATVTICHTGTPELRDHTKRADILIAAAGVPRIIKGDMVRKRAVVIDVGVNRIEDSSNEKGYRIVGDVDFEEVSKVAAAITPVPGGVGPMTIMMLMKNTVIAAGGFR